MFDQAELEAERLEERNGKDIQGAFFEERSDDGSESEGSLRDFLDDAEEEPASPFHMHRAIDRERSLSPPALPRTRRRHVLVSLSFAAKEGCSSPCRRFSAVKALSTWFGHSLTCCVLLAV